MTVFFSSFKPLCCTREGKKAVIKYSLSPYIDGSCRREPDLENDFPTITGLCRPNFVSKLNVSDIIIYTVKTKNGSMKIVAVLEVIEIFKTHDEAAKWYNFRKIKLPSNLMVNGNKPIEWEKTHKKPSLKVITNTKKWDKQYSIRARNHPDVAVCKIVNNIKDLINPVEISNEQMINIFGRVPGTQNPAKLSKQEWAELQKLLN